MTKEDLALRITRAMYKDRRSVERLKAFQSIKSYFLALEMGDLIGIASQYGIPAHCSEGI